MFIWCENCKKNFKLITFFQTKQSKFITGNLFTYPKASGNTIVKYELGKVAHALTGPQGVGVNCLAMTSVCSPVALD